MSIHDVSGVVGWCLGATLMFTIFTPFFTLGPASTTLYSTHALSHGLISSTTFLQHSTVYSSTAFLQSTTSTTPLWARCLAARGAGCPRSLLSHRMCTIRADGGASLRYFVYRTPLHHLHLLRPRARHALAAEGSTRGATALFFFLPPTIPLEHLIFGLPSVHPSACVVISCVWVSSRVS